MGWSAGRWSDDGAEKRGWTPEPLEKAWVDFELCDECRGSKRCDSCHGETVDCNACANYGWCFGCGGAGQWPTRPGVTYYRPRPPSRIEAAPSRFIGRAPAMRLRTDTASVALSSRERPPRTMLLVWCVVLTWVAVLLAFSAGMPALALATGAVGLSLLLLTWRTRA